jgi:hypothetical protein
MANMISQHMAGVVVAAAAAARQLVVRQRVRQRVAQNVLSKDQSMVGIS